MTIENNQHDLNMDSHSSSYRIEYKQQYESNPQDATREEVLEKLSTTVI